MTNTPDIQLSLSDLMDELHNLAGLDEGLPGPLDRRGSGHTRLLRQQLGGSS